MQTKLQIIQYDLQNNPRKKLCFVDNDTQITLTEKLNFNEILQSGYSDLETFLHFLKSKNLNTKEVRLDSYVPNGPKKLKKDSKEPLLVTWEPIQNLPLGEGASVKDAAAGIVAVSSEEKSSNQNNNTMNNQNANAENSPMFGMNAAMNEQITLRMKAEKYEDEKEKVNELKAKLKKVESKNDDLHVELREAKSDLKTAEKFKELELLKVSLEKKPFLDPETAKTAIEILGPVLGNLMQSQSTTPSTAGLSGVENLSEAKKSLIEEIKKDSFTEDMANNLSSLYVMILGNNDVVNAQLSQLIQNYNNQ